MEISNEFLINLLNIGTFIQFLTALTSTLYLKKYNNTILKYFSILLWYTFINEFVGILIIDYYSRFNAIIYNIYHVINFSYLLLLYRNYLTNKKYKKITLTFCIIYLIAFIINGFFENYIIEFNRFPYIIAALFLVVTIIFYFIEILNSEKVLNTKRNLLFWISVGLLLYFVGNLPFRILRNYYEDLADATVISLVNFTLTIVMNSCFIIGFIWSNKKQRY